MNKRLQFLFVVVLALLPLTLSASTWSFGWEKSKKNGGEGFYNFGANKETKDVYTTTLNGLTWNATLEGGQTLAYTSTMGQYFGMASEPCSKAKVWTSDLAGKIKSVKVTARLKDDTFAGNMAVTVNGKAYNCGKDATVSLTGTNTEYAFVPSEAQEGKIEIVINQTSESKNSIYIRKIEIEYESAASSVVAPVFTPAAGTYDEAQSVSLAVSGIEAGTYKIYYTTDGSNPRLADGSRMEYTAPIAVAATTTVKAVTMVGEEMSEVAEAKYVIRKDPQIRFNKEALTLVSGEEGYSDLLNPNKLKPITYKSSAQFVCSVDEYGALFSSYVTADAEAVITATFAGNEEYYPATAQMTVTVKAKTPLKAPEVTPLGGTFNAPVDVTITTDDAEAVTIWYSTTATSEEDFLNSDNTQSTVVEGHEATVTIDRSCTLYVMTRGYNVNSKVVTAQFVVNTPLKAEFTVDKSGTTYYEQGFDSADGVKDWTVGSGWVLKNKNFSAIDPKDVSSISIAYNVANDGESLLVSPELTVQEKSKVEFYAYFGPNFLVYGRWTFNVIDAETNESTTLFNVFDWAQENAYNAPNWNKFTFDLSAFAGKKVKFEFRYPFGGEDLAIDAFRLVKEDDSLVDGVRIFEGETVAFKNMSTGYPDTFEWAFPGATEETSNLENPVVKYNKAGTYDVALTVKSGDKSDRIERKGFVVVTQKAPTALIGLPEEGYESPYVGVYVPTNVPVQFKDLSTGNPTEWKWVFQNANIENSTEQNPTVTFVKKGVVSVGLTAKNDAGQTNDILQYAIQAGGAQYVWNIGIEENTKLSKVALGWYGNYAGSNWLGLDKFAEKHKAPIADARVDSVGVYFASVTAVDPEKEITLTLNSVADNGAPGEVLATAVKKAGELKYSDDDYLCTDFVFNKPVFLKKGTPFYVVVGPFPNESMDKAPYTTDDLAIFCLRRAKGEKTTTWQYVLDEDGNGGYAETGKWYENTDDPTAMAIAPVVAYDFETDGIQGVKTDAAVKGEVEAIYSVDGVKVSAMVPGGIYIVKYSDGSVEKKIAE